MGAQILYALVEQGLKKYDVQQYGVAQYLFATAPFWFVVLACGLISFGHRIIERGYVWLFRPQVLLRAPPTNPPSMPCCPSGGGAAPPGPLLLTAHSHPGPPLEYAGGEVSPPA